MGGTIRVKQYMTEEEYAREVARVKQSVAGTTGPETIEEALDTLLAEFKEMWLGKHHDYGTQNIMRHGHLGLAVRISDKEARLTNITMNNKVPSNEAREDTYKDFMGYGLVGVLLERGWFELPFAEDIHEAGGDETIYGGAEGRRLFLEHKANQMNAIMDAEYAEHLAGAR